ncbi:MAG: nitrogen regulation protein NR(II), partial [Burkholderiaceae bacterium]
MQVRGTGVRTESVSRPNPFDLLATAVVLLDGTGKVAFMNGAAENLLGVSAVQFEGQSLAVLATDSQAIDGLLNECQERLFSVKRQQMSFNLVGRPASPLDITVCVLEEPGLLASVELREIDAYQRIDREERQAALMQMNQSLLRNLGHEIKNPLGGIRGAAQLLETELPTRSLREYTQVIVKESDRLLSLVDQMLAPVRRSMSREAVNIHEVLERVRRLVLSEFPTGLTIVRDYDTSLPDILGDLEQLIQLVLNVVRNAAQAMDGQGSIWLKTRATRQVTLHRQRYALALSLSIRDNGPGIPKSLRDEIFYPLVSGNPKGHGLGLTIAQTIVHQHGGVIDCRS